MSAIFPSLTAIALTWPEVDSGKFVSKSLLEELAVDFTLQAASARQHANTAESVIDAIGNLDNGWDGYGAIAISAIICANAKKFLLNSPSELSRPEITPTSNGTVNFEWVSKNADAYLEIGQSRYTGHIQTDRGETIYLDGILTGNYRHDSSGIRQALALISGLLHATSSAPSIA